MIPPLKFLKPFRNISYGISYGMLIVSLIWCFKSGFDYEPIIVMFGAIVGVIIAHNAENKSNQDLKTDFSIYDKSDHAKLHQEIGDLILKSDRVVLIGIGLNILNTEALRQDIMDRFSKSSRHLEIYLANPYSASVEKRFIEEETGKEPPLLGKKGVYNKLRTLIKTWENLGRPGNIDLRVFNNYLTFALFIIDKEYYFYPYAFAKTGNNSPVFHFSKSNPKHETVINFLDEHYNDIKKSSVAAADLWAIKSGQSPAKSLMFPVAIYFIPAENSDLYKYGSETLGYDIYNKKNLKSSLDKDLVGGAKDFGFHLTVADALYFQNEREIREIEEELEYLLEDYSEFFLEDLQLKFGFPNDKCIAISCSDPSGTLSALHFEIVNRIYKKSIGSNYTLDKAKFDRPGPTQQKQKLYTTKFNAPYILDEYKPHFTLASNVGKFDDDFQGRIIRGFNDRVKSKSIPVNSLAILLFDDKKSQWYIHKTISIGKN